MLNGRCWSSHQCFYYSPVDVHPYNYSFTCIHYHCILSFLSFVRVAIIVVLPPPWKEYKKCSDCFHFKRKQNVYLLFSCPFTFVFWRNFPTIYTFCGRCFWFIRFLWFCFLFFCIFIRFGWCCSLTFLLVLFLHYKHCLFYHFLLVLPLSLSLPSLKQLTHYLSTIRIHMYMYKLV